jgi:SAM-dependent methyltransferase
MSSASRSAPEWDSHSWVKWATIQEILHRRKVPAGSRILDVGCGPAWLAIFLAQAGYRTTGIDIAPAFVESARRWAEAWRVPAEFEVRDMDDFSFEEQFDGAVVFDALHHSARQATVIRNIAASLRPGGWVLFVEPSLLHAISPNARRVQRELGWIERGISVRSLKRDCRGRGPRRIPPFLRGDATLRGADRRGGLAGGSPHRSGRGLRPGRVNLAPRQEAVVRPAAPPATPDPASQGPR